MEFFLTLSDEALNQLKNLKSNTANKKRYKAVVKAIKLLEQNPKHPSLNTHEHTEMSRELGEKVVDA